MTWVFSVSVFPVRSGVHNLPYGRGIGDELKGVWTMPASHMGRQLRLLPNQPLPRHFLPLVPAEGLLGVPCDQLNDEERT